MVGLRKLQRRVRLSDHGLDECASGCLRARSVQRQRLKHVHTLPVREIWRHGGADHGHVHRDVPSRQLLHRWQRCAESLHSRSIWCQSGHV